MTSAGGVFAGRGRPPIRLAVAFDVAMADPTREIVAVNGVAGAGVNGAPGPGKNGAPGPGKNGAPGATGHALRVNVIRANPMIRIVPEGNAENTGPYPVEEFANDAHATAVGAGSG